MLENFNTHFTTDVLYSGICYNERILYYEYYTNTIVPAYN